MRFNLFETKFELCVLTCLKLPGPPFSQATRVERVQRAPPRQVGLLLAPRLENVGGHLSLVLGPLGDHLLRPG